MSGFNPEPDEDVVSADELDELRAAELDPFYFHFAPGYATEMDMMNADEADDYGNEGADYDF